MDVRTIWYMFVQGDLQLAGSEARIVGAIVCCFAMLLFVTGNLIVDTAIIFAVHQAIRGRSIATIVLVETLNGLDIVFADQGEFFQGAPNLLYMWLLGRHRFVSANQI